MLTCLTVWYLNLMVWVLHGWRLMLAVYLPNHIIEINVADKSMVFCACLINDLLQEAGVPSGAVLSIINYLSTQDTSGMSALIWLLLCTQCFQPLGYNIKATSNHHIISSLFSILIIRMLQPIPYNLLLTLLTYNSSHTHWQLQRSLRLFHHQLSHTRCLLCLQPAPPTSCLSKCCHQ